MTPEEWMDRQALRDLVERYAAIPDDRNYALVDEVFSAEGVLAGEGYELTGREQIRAGMRGIERFTATLHCVHNHQVELDGDSAAGTTYCVANHLREIAGVPHKLDWGIRYSDSYVREAEGWRIARRELRVVWEQELPLRLQSS